MTWATAFFGSVAIICITVMVCVVYLADKITNELNKDNSTRTK